MKLSLKRNLLIGFGSSLLILILSSVASLISITNLLNSRELVDHTTRVVQRLEETISVMKDAETGQRGYLITGKEEFLEPYNGSAEKVRGLIKEVKALTVDNPVQQQNTDRLEVYVTRRFWKLQELIDRKKLTSIVNISDMVEGKVFMDSVRTMVKDMTATENALLAKRTEKLDRFTAVTPILIVVAALLALTITILFYIKTNRDLTERGRLQEELLKKDAAIGRRINIIQSIAGKISAGDYSVRVNDSEQDDLGGIALSLDKMSVSLQQSFNSLADKEWLQSGLAGLNEVIIGDDNLSVMAEKITAFLATYSNSLAGAFYVCENETLLKFEQGYALDADHIKHHIAAGDGMAGQCLRTRKPVVLNDVQEKDFVISFATSRLKPGSIIVFPLIFENRVKGVVELAALHAYTHRELDFFNSVSGVIGIAVNTIQNRQRVQELLEETQSQAEELMTQQSELEQINTELEALAQQLQTSEEELKVQSEELQQTNQLLEEKSMSLEQRNQVIVQKNIEIEKKAADLAQSTRYKSEFLANMSHELRTPLNSILLLSRLLTENNEQNLTKDQVQYAQVIQASGNGLLQLIDEILDLSKIESGKMTIEFLPVQVSAVSAGLQELFAPLAKEKQLQWKIVVGAEVPAVIETDQLRLEQVLKNLLSNAFKFTSEGYIHLLVNCPQDRPDYICFTVKDSGIGISAEKQDLIFEAFQQEDGSTRRKYGGTGLGLSISRELARLLGGEIGLTSNPGEGSEFTCCIPQVPGKAAPKEPLVKNLSKGKSHQQATGIAPENEFAAYYTDAIPDEIADDRNNLQSGDKVVLIIEDDVNFAASLLEYARQKGYKGVVAVRGDRGIEMAIEYQPMGILLDLRLPVKNGWEVMDALKKNPDTRYIPVHMMSSLEVRNESLRKGAVDFITKPVAFEKLHTIFEKLEMVLAKTDNKVLIIEENEKHAKALAYYLGTYNVSAAVYSSVEDSIRAVNNNEADCVILDMSAIDADADHLLERIRKEEGLENLPVILFTGKSLSQPEEFKLKQYADAIVLKTAHSYRRILDEVSLFLHLVQEQQSKKGFPGFEKFILEENVLKGKKVLLADDDVRNIFSMTKTLEKYQMQVIPALDGREALSLMKANKPDVVLMDMMMPEMDGYESIRAIRKEPQYKNVPIIAVTAKAMTGDREKCIAAGASDYISKPVDIDQLVSLLRIWLYEKSY